MEKNGYKNTPHRLTIEDCRRGGQSRSLQKRISVAMNPLKNRKTITKKLAEKIEIQGGDINALKALLRLSSTESGRVLVDEMVTTLIHMKEIVDDKPTLQKYDTFMRNLVLFKECVWGKTLTVNTEERSGLLVEFKEKLETVEKD